VGRSEDAAYSVYIYKRSSPGRPSIFLSRSPIKLEESYSGISDAIADLREQSFLLRVAREDFVVRHAWSLPSALP